MSRSTLIPPGASARSARERRRTTASPPGRPHWPARGRSERQPRHPHLEPPVRQSGVASASARPGWGPADRRRRLPHEPRVTVMIRNPLRLLALRFGVDRAGQANQCRRGRPRGREEPVYEKNSFPSGSPSVCDAAYHSPAKTWLSRHHRCNTTIPRSCSRSSTPAAGPTGRARAPGWRSTATATGIWHSIAGFCASRGGGGGSSCSCARGAKDTFPDGGGTRQRPGTGASASRPEQAAREIAEELGMEVGLSIGWSIPGASASIGRFPNGLIDREHHEVYMLRTGRRRSTAYRPDPTEVSGLAAWDSREAMIELLCPDGRATLIRSTEAIRVGHDGAMNAWDVVARTRGGGLVPLSRGTHPPPAARDCSWGLLHLAVKYWMHHG